MFFMLQASVLDITEDSEININNTVTYLRVCDYRLVSDWLPDLLHTSQIIIWHTMSSQSVTVFTSRCLVKDVNNGYSSVSVLKSRIEFL
jgi:hypothetical protein